MLYLFRPLQTYGVKSTQLIIVRFVLIILREQRRPCSFCSIVRADDDDGGGDDEVQLSLGQYMTEWAETLRVGGDEGRVYSAFNSRKTHFMQVICTYIHAYMYINIYDLFFSLILDNVS